MAELERHQYDVVVIGAGGAGLRAVIEARERGLRVAVVTKSLFGKAHTVMAEGGCAAAMRQRQRQGHLADPLRRHHARRQVPEQLADGRTARPGGPRPGVGAGDLRRAVRPHQGRQDQPAQLRRPHLPAAGARRRPHRPGDHPHHAAEDRLAAAGGQGRTRRLRGPDQGVPRVHDHRADQGRRQRRSPGAFGYWRETGNFILFEAPAVVLATGGIGKSFKVSSNSWEYTGDGHALALRAGRHADQHGVHPVPPHRHGLAAVASRASSSPRACAATAEC